MATSLCATIWDRHAEVGQECQPILLGARSSHRYHTDHSVGGRGFSMKPSLASQHPLFCFNGTPSWTPSSPFEALDRCRGVRHSGDWAAGAHWRAKLGQDPRSARCNLVPALGSSKKIGPSGWRGSNSHDTPQRTEETVAQSSDHPSSERPLGTENSVSSMVIAQQLSASFWLS